jgi:hypothetical protein
MKSDLLGRMSLMQCIQQGRPIPQGCGHLVSRPYSACPFVWQSSHPAVPFALAAMKRHGADYKPRSTDIDLREAGKDLRVGIERARVPPAKLRLVEQVEIAPDLFCIEGQNHYTALKLAADLIETDLHGEPQSSNESN